MESPIIDKMLKILFLIEKTLFKHFARYKSQLLNLLIFTYFPNETRNIKRWLSVLGKTFFLFTYSIFLAFQDHPIQTTIVCVATYLFIESYKMAIISSITLPFFGD